MRKIKNKLTKKFLVFRSWDQSLQHLLGKDIALKADMASFNFNTKKFFVEVIYYKKETF